jgi:hypothetical protein
MCEELRIAQDCEGWQSPFIALNPGFQAEFRSDPGWVALRQQDGALVQA